MLKNTNDISFFLIIPIGAIRYSVPIRLVPTYILLTKEIRLLGKFQPDSFKTERLVCVETDGQTDMARSTRLVMLIKNIYTLWGGNVSFTALQTSDWNQYTLCKGIKMISVWINLIALSEFHKHANHVTIRAKSLCNTARRSNNALHTLSFVDRVAYPDGVVPSQLCHIHS